LYINLIDIEIETQIGEHSRSFGFLNHEDMEKTESVSGKGKRVIVIGGGIAGSLASKFLQFDSDLTLIDP